MDEALRKIFAEVMSAERPQIVKDVIAALSDMEQKRNNATQAHMVKRTRKEAADQLRVTIGTIDNWRKDGVLPYERAGKKVLISQRVIDEFTRQRRLH